MPEQNAGETPQRSFSAAMERDMAIRLIQGEDDAVGFIAFALHRRAFLDWQEAYFASEGKEPVESEIRLFLLGEQADRRLQAYREHATLLMAMPEEPAPPILPARPMPERRPLRTWFWPWGMSTGFVLENPDRPINWKGLILRLALLALAVIVSALALRFLVVRA
jgi:hypothetical protein